MTWAPARPLVLAAPSGTGKTTIARRLVEESPGYVFSVSATTRAPRPGERDGVDYDFVDEGEFREMAMNGALVEWAEVHGRLYGTPFRNLEEAAARGEHVVLDIDVQGARQIRNRVPNAVLVFVLPPSGEALVRRLTARGTEGGTAALRRLRNAKEELKVVGEFDHAVVNDEIEEALRSVRSIVAGDEHGATARVADPGAMAERLIGEIDEIVNNLEE